MSDVILKLTREQAESAFSIDEWFNLGELTTKELYDKMLCFVVDADGNPVDRATARKMFKGVPQSEFPSYISKFYQAITDAFVNPTKGDSSASPITAEPEQSPDGSVS